MKKMILAIAAAVMMSASVLAQDNKPEGRRGGMGRMDRTEMLKHRTDETVKQYGLNEEQAAKLLDLNTRYADKMGPRFGGPRGERRHRPDSMRPHTMRPDSMKPMKEMKNAPEKRERMPQMRGADREQMQKDMEAYDAELKQIMTEEQYKAYKADQEKRRQEGPRGRRPQRQEN